MFHRDDQPQTFSTLVLGPFCIEAQHPDEFIAHVLTLVPAIALAAIKDMRARLLAPPFVPEAFLEHLARQRLPQTVAIVRNNIGII